MKKTNTCTLIHDWKNFLVVTEDEEVLIPKSIVIIDDSEEEDLDPVPKDGILKYIADPIFTAMYCLIVFFGTYTVLDVVFIKKPFQHPYLQEQKPEDPEVDYRGQ